MESSKSRSATANATSAAKHVLHALNAQPKDILADGTRNFRRAHPAKPKYDDIPNVHEALNVCQELASKSNTKDVRAHAMITLALATSRRMADLARIWNHPRCFKFTIVAHDTPQWARRFESQAGPILSKLGYLTRTPRADNEFIRMSIRSYRSKTTGPKGILYDRWVAITEYRADPRLCTVLAMAKYLQATKEAKVEHKLKYDSHTTIDCLYDDNGSNPVKSTPLFISLKGPQHTGLQPGTFAGVFTRKLLKPLNWISYSPHIMRAMSASFKHAYGIPVDTCVLSGDWADKQTFYKHYLRLTHTPIHPKRLADVSLHDWVTLRAHNLLAREDSRAQGTSSATTNNDEAIAQALSLHPSPPRRSSRRRNQSN